MVEWLQTEIALWLGSLSAWVQTTLGMSVEDIALFTGGILTVFAVLWLGVHSGKPRRREAARCGWLLLLLAIVILGWGLYNHDLSSG
jgi:hypothetical protein